MGSMVVPEEDGSQGRDRAIGKGGNADWAEPKPSAQG